METIKIVIADTQSEFYPSWNMAHITSQILNWLWSQLGSPLPETQPKTFLQWISKLGWWGVRKGEEEEEEEEGWGLEGPNPSRDTSNNLLKIRHRGTTVRL